MSKDLNFKRMISIVHNIGVQQEQQEQQAMANSTTGNNESASLVEEAIAAASKTGVLDLSFYKINNKQQGEEEEEEAAAEHQQFPQAVVDYLQQQQQQQQQPIVHTLNLQHNFLRSIPSSQLFGPVLANTLQHLDLSHNDLTLGDVNNSATLLLCDTIGQLATLKSINLSFNRLEGTIDLVALVKKSLNSIEIINIANNKISALTTEAAASSEVSMPKLTTLVLNNNQITSEAWQQFCKQGGASYLPNLKQLLLNANQLKGEFNIVESHCTQVVQLLLQENQITSVTQMDQCSTQLEELDMSYNQLQGDFAMPTNAGEALKICRLNDNQITQFVNTSKDNKKLSKLTTILLHGNKLKQVDSLVNDCCSSLGDIETFTIHSNELTILPNLLCEQLSHLEQLYLQNNKLTSVPQSLAKMKSLKEIDLFHNELKTIPDGVLGQLELLERLILDDNTLLTIPIDIVNCTKLYYLSARNNPQLKVSPFIRAMMVNK